MVDAYLCLGSNDVAANEYLAAARERLGSLSMCRIVASSSVYLTEPQNLRKQPWFHNQVVKMSVSESLSSAELLKNILAIESVMGRKRNGPRFGPRSIDIDLLLFGDVKSDDPFCTLPHPRLSERAFALVPLLELDPEISISGVKAKALLERLNWHMETNRIFQ